MSDNNDNPISDLLKLPLDERIKTVQDLWDSIIELPESIDLTNEQKKELEERLKAYHENPESGSPWSEIKARKYH